MLPPQWQRARISSWVVPSSWFLPSVGRSRIIRAEMCMFLYFDRMDRIHKMIRLPFSRPSCSSCKSCLFSFENQDEATKSSHSRRIPAIIWEKSKDKSAGSTVRGFASSPVGQFAGRPVCQLAGSPASSLQTQGSSLQSPASSLQPPASRLRTPSVIYVRDLVRDLGLDFSGGFPL
jgi:hypothetical protein